MILGKSFLVYINYQFYYLSIHQNNIERVFLGIDDDYSMSFKVSEFSIDCHYYKQKIKEYWVQEWYSVVGVKVIKVRMAIVAWKLVLSKQDIIISLKIHVMQNIYNDHRSKFLGWCNIWVEQGAPFANALSLTFFEERSTNISTKHWRLQVS